MTREESNTSAHQESQVVSKSKDRGKEGFPALVRGGVGVGRTGHKHLGDVLILDPYES